MTLQSFYRRVPFVDLTQDQYGNIRHCGDEDLCPIDCAGGDWTKKGGDLGLTKKDVNLIIRAADATTKELTSIIDGLSDELTRKRTRWDDLPLKAADRKAIKNEIAFARRALQIRQLFERRIAKAQGRN